MKTPDAVSRLSYSKRTDAPIAGDSWDTERNPLAVTVTCLFTNEAVRTKRNRLYPTIGSVENWSLDVWEGTQTDRSAMIRQSRTEQFRTSFIWSVNDSPNPHTLVIAGGHNSSLGSAFR